MGTIQSLARGFTGGLVCVSGLVCVVGCALAFAAAPPELHVAAAANLTQAMPQLDAAFERTSHIHVVPSFGATAQLVQQIQNGAPFDVFLAADVEHVDELIRSGFGLRESSAIYARGQLILWTPKRPDLKSLDALTRPDIRAIGVAKPELAPYGEAAIEMALKNAKLWDKVEAKVVYAPSIAVAKQFADTGNADAAFTALALVVGEAGHYITIDEKLHKPIEQALCIVKASKEEASARAFTAFLAGSEGRAILKRFGYAVP